MEWSGGINIKYFILYEGDQPELVDVWMEKATAINKVCKDFFTVSLDQSTSALCANHCTVCRPVTS